MARGNEGAWGEGGTVNQRRAAVGLAGGLVLTGGWALGVAAEPVAGGETRPQLFEVAAFGGVALGGNFRLEGGNGVTADESEGLADRATFAAAFDLQADVGSQYELFYSREASDLGGNSAFPRTDLTVEYLHVGGRVLLDDQPGIEPYVVGGVGATRFSPGEQGSSDTRFSASLGLGLRWPVSRRFSMRLEGRGFVTLMDSNTAIFCQSDQSGLLCRIHGHGQTFVQGQLLAAVAFAF